MPPPPMIFPNFNGHLRVPLTHLYLLFFPLARARPRSPGFLSYPPGHQPLGHPSLVLLHFSDSRLRIRETLCGLPSGIHLGNPHDWGHYRRRAEHLGHSSRHLHYPSRSFDRVLIVPRT